eukprot:TRINITY_DN16825_c0_g1_i3.p1 TRINITY_DN16825_c0_g1~~TRINITY_DN16825_c0_g1_i3.p1  ORF type:complete len:143 (-),score=23.17 TRINITY_DN16825_c0_g1_i3:89-517(-)
MTARSLTDGDAETSFFGIPLKSKYYPVVLVSVFALLSGPAVLRDLAALAVGYLHRPLNLVSLLPSEALLLRWENAGCRFIFNRQLFGGRWIRVNDALGGFGSDGSYPAPAASQGYHALGRSQLEGRGTQFAVFSGTGRRLGS